MRLIGEQEGWVTSCFQGATGYQSRSIHIQHKQVPASDSSSLDSDHVQKC